jgi:hypothetical protein
MIAQPVSFVLVINTGFSLASGILPRRDRNLANLKLCAIVARRAWLYARFRDPSGRKGRHGVAQWLGLSKVCDQPLAVSASIRGGKTRGYPDGREKRGFDTVFTYFSAGFRRVFERGSFGALRHPFTLFRRFLPYRSTRGSCGKSTPKGRRKRPQKRAVLTPLSASFRPPFGALSASFF